MADHIRYDLLTQQALRSVVRSVLSDAAKKGLPGDHHFYISFDTRAPGVHLSSRLRAQYPEEMTIILQHQFWDLKIADDGFEVGLSFGGITEKVGVPFEAVKGFFDPSVQFGLQFEEVVEGEQQPAAGESKPASNKKRSSAAPTITVAAAPPVPAGKAPEANKTEKPEKPEKTEKPESPDKPDKPTGGAEVVRLDRFRKK
jgi:hypothetical protein